MTTHNRVRTDRLPGLVTTAHTFDVPLDHADPGGERITVFGREVVAAGKEREELPWLMMLQGGPGMHCERPTDPSAWLGRALQEYRVLLLDQRGTGLSSRVSRQTLPRRGAAKAQAEYLTHFRADSIVRDAELVRRALIGEQKWSIYGQSYGGFCSLTYLSLFPESLRESLVTGGLAPLTASAEEVYRALYPRVVEKNKRFFARYPGDVELTRRVVEHLLAHDVRLPTGERLTAHRFQTLGMTLGAQRSFDFLHYLLESAFVDGVAGPELSDEFLANAGARLSFAVGPMYALVHESIYAQGRATDWAAQRVRAEFGEFDVEGDGPVLYTGEMIYPWQFDEDPALTPLKDVAEILAAKSDWGPLYDLDRLARNEVPVAAAVYYDDMYVDREYSMATAAAVGNTRVWVTNEFEHDGAGRSAGVLDRLIKMARGEL
ncbi:pimeloyl-ACP methyl ester carboxylesterase [Crossiella equi]|uniref:Pimeloyl-ACP methyl ester carboxylesterase n=1 Tax=Crossiella equi TaxID=130796 RepID=A0ABS5A8Z9_9PSEU|nr:alpha/beta fold hydrolase [Crossiella equi]MBP2472782.1 pimeloyl-ACP methyl ester carboxylesterase [Crossiella equi]